MQPALQMEGVLHLEWGPHRYELRGDQGKLTLRSLTGFPSLLRLLIWSRFKAPPGLRSALSFVQKRGGRLKILWR
jgi:hypothetical protein